MTVTLSAAIARVRFLLDDTDSNPLVSDSDITLALQVAQEEVWQLVVTSGANIFYQQASVTTTSTGAANISSIAPIKIANVAKVVDNYRVQIPPARFYDNYTNVLQSMTLLISYVPRATFPALAGDPFVWSQSTINLNTLDQLMIHIAASQCWVRTGEPPNAAIEKRKQELLDSIHTLVSIPSWSATPVGATDRSVRDAGFSWIRTAHDQLQIIYGG